MHPKIHQCRICGVMTPKPTTACEECLELGWTCDESGQVYPPELAYHRNPVYLAKRSKQARALGKAHQAIVALRTTAMECLKKNPNCCALKFGLDNTLTGNDLEG